MLSSEPIETHAGIFIFCVGGLFCMDNVTQAFGCIEDARDWIDGLAGFTAVNGVIVEYEEAA